MRLDEQPVAVFKADELQAAPKLCKDFFFFPSNNYTMQLSPIIQFMLSQCIRENRGKVKGTGHQGISVSKKKTHNKE